MNNKKIIRSWALYDWANSVYSLVISTTVFPIYFASVSPEKLNILGQWKSASVYTFIISLSFIVISLLSPILSAMADISGQKKKFMTFFFVLGALSTSCMFFFTKEHIWFGLILSFMASIGFSGSLVFYNSYLPEIAPKEDQDKVSAKGFAMGYLGGAILQILILVLIEKFELFGLSDKGIATRIGFLIVGLWWLIFGFKSISGLPKDEKKTVPKNSNIIKDSFLKIKAVSKSTRNFPKLRPFLWAFFMFSTGVQTIILVASLYGKDVLGLETGDLILTILLIQFVAFGGSHLFAYFSKKFGNISALLISTSTWFLICIGAFFVTSRIQFFVFGALVGLVLGGIQSIARSTYSKFLPKEEEHTTYFSFYDFLEKWSIVVGTLLFSIITEFIEMKYTSLMLALFFVISIIILAPLNSKKNRL
ncbi:MAG: MFS transporter [Flavobacteriales bacterium]|jgi:UMF1 family MFS transporter|nr:MFS transporter [Flavobacteriales bacterium]